MSFSTQDLNLPKATVSGKLQDGTVYRFGFDEQASHFRVVLHYGPHSKDTLHDFQTKSDAVDYLNGLGVSTSQVITNVV